MHCRSNPIQPNEQMPFEYHRIDESEKGQLFSEVYNLEKWLEVDSNTSRRRLQRFSLSRIYLGQQ